MSNRKVDETSTLGGWLTRGAQLDLQGIHLQAVENLVRKSTPDREGHVRGVGQFWVELKAARRPVRSSTPVSFVFQDGQANWLRKRWAFGGNAWLLCQVGSASGARRYLFEGRLAAHVEAGQVETWMEQHCVIHPMVEARELIYRMASGHTSE